MNDSIRNEAEAHELRREIPFRSAPEAEANEGTNTPINDPDRILSHRCAYTSLPRPCDPGACSCLVTNQTISHFF